MASMSEKVKKYLSSGENNQKETGMIPMGVIFEDLKHKRVVIAVMTKDKNINFKEAAKWAEEKIGQTNDL